MREAMFYDKQDDRALCRICPNKCIIKQNYKGICGTRIHQDGKLYAENYGKVTAINIDPIEKKPLYHWHPGTQILSIGSYGCNLRCPFCQNHEISMGKPKVINMTPDAIVAQAKAYDLQSIAYTYNEPTIYYEMVYDTAKLAKKEGLSNVLVTNGYINEEPLLELLPYIDALNIDVKTYDDKKMVELCGGKLEHVLNTIRHAVKTCHVEITMLIVPGLNNDVVAMDRFCKYLRSDIGDIPIHISRYFPRYQYDAPATDIALMLRMKEVVSKHFTNVYLGNVNVQ